MMRKFIASFITVVTLGLCLAPAALAFNPLESACNLGGDSSSSAVCQDQKSGTTNPLTGPNGLLRGIADIIAVAAGIAAVIIIIISGLRFVTAGGDPAKVKAAREALVTALIGLVVIALAGSIISFVLSKL